MDFRVRVVSISFLLALLIAAFLLGEFLSPERAQESAARKPLLPVAASGEIAEVEIVYRGNAEVTLRRKDGGWEARTVEHVYPGSADRIESFVKNAFGLTRGKIVSRDPGLRAELGLSEDSARLLVLRRGADRSEIGLLVGKRGPSGDEDYMMVKGEDAAYLVRGSLAFFLSQDRAYWYELHVLPDEVRGTSISRISVSGSLSLGGTQGETLRGPYTLVRGTGERDGEWTMLGEKRPVNRLAAGAMANSLALLEGVDFSEPAPDKSSGNGRLDVEVSTLEGKTYSFRVRLGTQAAQFLVTTSWSAWTYLVNELPLKRAIPKVSDLFLQ
jgi:hypothetical protein